MRLRGRPRFALVLTALACLAAHRCDAAVAVVRDSAYTAVSSDSAWTLDVHALTFEDPVEAAVWDSARACVIVQAGRANPDHASNSIVSGVPFKSPRLIAYDVDRASVAWTQDDGVLPAFVHGDRLAGWKGDDGVLLDAATGARDPGWPGSAWYFVRNGTRVAVAPGEVTGFDDATGQRLWSTPFATPAALRGCTFYGDSLFVYGDALKAVDIRSGFGWERDVHPRSGG